MKSIKTVNKTNNIVSVRMPKTLILKLKKLSTKKDFMDLSEQIRFIVRKKCSEYNNSQDNNILKLKKELEDEILKKKSDEQKVILNMMQQLIEEMKRRDSE